MSRYSDYFSFESIRDREGEVICYHVTLIGTIETDGTATMRTDMGANQWRGSAHDSTRGFRYGSR